MNYPRVIFIFPTRYAQVVHDFHIWDDDSMKERLLKSLHASLEWRLIAFVITELFFFVTSGELWHATVMALLLQLILLIAHFAWFYVRETKPAQPSAP